jgi:CBS domain-containing protein
MKTSDPISDIMTDEVITISVNDSLYDAENLFKKNKIRHIPVVNGKKIIGMLSYTDLLRISFADAVDEDGQIDSTVYDMFAIEQVMARNIQTIDINSSVKDAAEVLAEKEFHALPVVKDKNLVGIITTTDLIKFLLRQEGL